MDTATQGASRMSWWALLLAAEAILLALGLGITLDATGATIGDLTPLQGAMLAAVMIFVAACAILLISWLRVDGHASGPADIARGWWTAPALLAVEALLVAGAAGVAWDYSASSPLLDPTLLQAVMLGATIIFFVTFIACFVGLLRGEERA
jgi:hypothetical protein